MIMVEDNVTGKKFGMLTVMYMTGAICHCVCECGSLYETERYRLKSGHTKSCGCLKRKRTFNRYEINDGVVKLFFREHEILLDIDDFRKIKFSGWHVSGFGYAYSNVGNKLMHRIIVPTVEPYVFDHVNRNKLDNRKRNLRVVTKSQNSLNMPLRSGMTGEHHITMSCGYYRVQIANKNYGNYKTLDMAIMARDKAISEIGLSSINYDLMDIRHQ